MLAEPLLAWYDEHKRSLPFRDIQDPYRIWISEIMLQQTRTETVGVYYRRFLARFPDVFSLAAAQEQEVLKCWEGLGYYSRARNLHKAAKAVVSQYNGVFPADVAALRSLPGVGDYTAAAVASIAFGLPAPAMDGNLTRVLSRVHGIREDVGIPSVKRRLLVLAQQDMPSRRCGDFNQALMDLGASVCVPGTPDCEKCPLNRLCDACRAGDADTLPVKSVSKPPLEIDVNAAVVTCRGRVLMVQRRETLLKGLWVFPLTENPRSRQDTEKTLKALGVRAGYRRTLETARHVFTHRIWNMTIDHYRAETPECAAGRFVTLNEMNGLPLPTAMRAARDHVKALLTPRVLPGEENVLPVLASAYALSWQDSHAAFCSPDFLAAHDPKHMEAVLRSQREAGRDVFGLWLAGEAAGVLVLDRKENELCSLYIHPDDQGLGLGKAALLFTVGFLDQARDMKVTVLQNNLRARRLYEQFGFDQTAETRVLDASRNLTEETLMRKAAPHVKEGP